MNGRMNDAASAGQNEAPETGLGVKLGKEWRMYKSSLKVCLSYSVLQQQS